MSNTQIFTFSETEPRLLLFATFIYLFYCYFVEVPDRQLWQGCKGDGYCGHHRGDKCFLCDNKLLFNIPHKKMNFCKEKNGVENAFFLREDTWGRITFVSQFCLRKNTI